MTIHQEPTPVPEKVSPELTDAQLQELAGGYAHSTESDLKDTEAPTRKALKQGEKTPFWTKKRVIFGLATGALGIAIPTAAVVATTQSAPVAEAPGDPTDAPAPVETSAEPIPVETEAPIAEAEYSVSRESVAAYIEMSPEQFATLPKTEQLKLVAYYMQGSDELGGLAEFAQNYSEVSGNPLDILPEDISPENTAAEISTIAGYAKRFTFALEGPERQKFLYAILENGTSSPSYAILSGASEELPTTSERIARIMAGTNSLEAAVTTGASDLIKDEGGTYKSLTYQNGQVKKSYFYSIPVDVGSFEIWIDE